VLVDDVNAVHPGELVALGRPARAETIWSPSVFAADPIDDPAVAGRELKRLVTTCTSHLVSGYDRLLLEISGGLDSAILAGTLHLDGQISRVVEGLNIAFGRPESDEQAFACAVADRVGLRLVERRHMPQALDLEDLAEISDAFGPSANAVDPKWDHDEIERVQATGAQAIVSGQGGDAVFMQMSGPGVIADAWAREGWRTLRRPILGDVARRNRTSVWRLLRDARAQRRGRARPSEAFWSSLITAEVRSATQDLKPRWLQEAEDRGLPPGKQLHIHALARFLLNEGPSRRRREADTLYPLFAQPVVEHVLRIPTPVLAGASYDRAYARTVFADRLPEIVQARRAKGMVTVYFARLIANSLPALRPFLVDGCLAQAHVLDRAKLEQALTPEHLIWAAKPSDILWAVAAEAWVRHWQTRVPDSLSAPRRR
jgi:asparagine synthase (glutamine-hydrolysing)